ncbi:MAG TPA: hypothetical protein VFS10_15265 [Pyrinomonadaceae bacterium]|nr:hypothetical protein [Pyrinomonadaceae bacterium]
MLLGIHLGLLIGPSVAVIPPVDITEALTGATVTQNDRGRSGFQLTFEVGRSGPVDMFDYGLLLNPLLKPFNRVVLTVSFSLVPEVIMDGIITNVQLQPTNEPGASTLTVTGEDVSVLMDMKQEAVAWPAMSADNIVRLIVAKYAQYAIVPQVSPALFPSPPLPTERVPVQTMSDYQYVQFLAARQGYVFYVEPGPVPNTNVAYWGPPKRAGLPQRALTIAAGPDSNISSVSFNYNALAPTTVSGHIQDSRTNLSVPLRAPAPLRVPLSARPAALVNRPNVRQSLPPVTREQAEEQESLSQTGSSAPSGRSYAHARTVPGLDAVEALARAQATVDASTDNVVTATGELDAVEYGAVLKARELVGVRGVGFTYGGNYYVQSVTHHIREGEYKQKFTLAREGTGALLPLVRP